MLLCSSQAKLHEFMDPRILGMRSFICTVPFPNREKRMMGEGQDPIFRSFPFQNHWWLIKKFLEIGPEQGDNSIPKNWLRQGARQVLRTVFPTASHLSSSRKHPEEAGRSLLCFICPFFNPSGKFQRQKNLEIHAEYNAWRRGHQCIRYNKFLLNVRQRYAYIKWQQGRHHWHVLSTR